MPFSLRRKLTIISLLIYWSTIFILAHIPIPQLVYRARVSDKALHVLVYLILIFLLWFSVASDGKVNWRKAAVWWMVLVVAGYGALDEWLQGYVGRSCDAADLAADFAGVLAGLIVLSVLTFWPAFLTVTAITIFILSNLTQVNPAELVPITNALFHLFAYGIFAMLWIYNMQNLLPGKVLGSKWLLCALAGPMGFLFIVKSATVIFGKSFSWSDVIIAALSIAAVVITTFLTTAFRHSLQNNQ